MHSGTPGGTTINNNGWHIFCHNTTNNEDFFLNKLNNKKIVIYLLIYIYTYTRYNDNIPFDLFDALTI